MYPLPPEQRVKGELLVFKVDDDGKEGEARRLIWLFDSSAFTHFFFSASSPTRRNGIVTPVAFHPIKGWLEKVKSG